MPFCWNHEDLISLQRDWIVAVLVLAQKQMFLVQD